MKHASRFFMVIAFLLLLNVIPIEQETISENGVTPAPPSHFSQLIGKKLEETDIDTSKENVPSIDKAKDKEVTNSEVLESNISTDIIDRDVIIKKKDRRKRTNVTQPVCKYGMSEIFFFEPTWPISSIAKKENLPQEDVTLEGKDSTAVDTREGTKEVANAETKNETEISKEDETDSDMKLEVADMQSFEEWKNVKLQEQESRMAEIVPTPTRTVRAKKTQVNYASQDCGAKVLAHNKEAKHVGAILDENKDLYMLNPCSTAIWFVIELCEPIQVEQLQIGNLELFSSAPKEFTVSVSERYPAREWHTIGTFEATNERILQGFSPKADDLMFAKYIKFEMLSHFSNEHFCPLTLVRVLGISMVDEFDESEHTALKEINGENTVEANQGVIVDDASKESDGPINTMLNIVKTAIGLNNGAEGEKAADAKNSSEERNADVNDTESIDPTAESEVVLVTNETDIVNVKENSSFITLIETGHGEDLTEYLRNLTVSPRKIPLYIPKFIQYLAPFSKKFNVNMCWFLEFFCKVSFAGCLVHYPYNLSALGLFIPLSVPIDSTGGIDVESKSLSMNVTKLEPASNLEDLNEGINVNMESDDRLLSTNIDSNDISVDTSTQLEIIEQAQEPVEINEATRTTLKEGNSADESSHVTIPPQEIDSKQQNVEVKTNDSDVKETDVVLYQTTGASETEVATSTTADGAVGEGKAEKGVVASLDDSDESSTTTTISPSTADVNSYTDNSPTPPPVVINPGTNQKDSVFMRLSNRIRVLEQNMSLSSDYLETLSQRYKKQMDEMQRAFNQTTTKLLSTSRTANENDARQTELIQQAQAEIDFLREKLENLTVIHDQLNMQLVERHVCLILLEIIIFVAVLVTCMGRRMTQVRGDVARAEDLLEQLERKLKKVQRNSHVVRGNGHCHSAPYNPPSDPPPPSIVITTKQSKKQKRRRSGQKNAVSAEMRQKGDNHDSITGKNERENGYQMEIGQMAQMEIEDIGKKPTENGWKVQNNTCTEEKTQNWNGNALPLKIPNGHVKGRK